MPSAEDRAKYDPFSRDDLRGRVFTAMTGLEGPVGGSEGDDLLAMLRAVGGRSNRTRSRIDLGNAAKTLGVSRDTVARWARSAETGQGKGPSADSLRSLANRAQRAGWSPGATSGPGGSGGQSDVLGMLRAVGGMSSRTRSGIDLGNAAKALGVSRRTVERWALTAMSGRGQSPSGANLLNLTSRARQAATTQSGRQAAIAGSASAKAVAARGARLTINAFQGPFAQGKNYNRNRITQMQLDAGDAQSMLDAWQSGGDAGFLTWARDYWGDNYVPGWEFGQVDEIKVEYLHGGEWR